MLQLYNRQGWDFHRDLRTKYGPVSRLQFLFGVSGFSMLCPPCTRCLNAVKIETDVVRLRPYGYANRRPEGASAPRAAFRRDSMVHEVRRPAIISHQGYDVLIGLVVALD